MDVHLRLIREFIYVDVRDSAGIQPGGLGARHLLRLYLRPRDRNTTVIHSLIIGPPTWRDGVAAPAKPSGGHVSDCRQAPGRRAFAMPTAGIAWEGNLQGRRTPLAARGSMSADGRSDWRWAVAGKRAQVGLGAEWCKTIGPSQTTSNRRLGVQLSRTLSTTAATSRPSPSSTKRRHLHLLPCWTDAER